MFQIHLFGCFVLLCFSAGVALPFTKQHPLAGVGVLAAGLACVGFVVLLWRDGQLPANGVGRGKV